RLNQYRFDACPQLAAERIYPGALLYPAHRSAHHVFTDRAVHVQQRRIEPISPHRVDMRIAPVSAQDRECCRAQYIHHRAPAVAYKRSGVLLTKSSHRPPACRNCAKNNSCPSRVTGASSSNSAKYRPPGVSTGHGRALKHRSPSASADLPLPSSSIPQKINILLQLPFYSIAVFRLSGDPAAGETREKCRARPGILSSVFQYPLIEAPNTKDKIVAPVESTARYKYTHLPSNRM